MSTRLFLRLPAAESDPLQSLVLTESGELVQECQTIELHDLRQLANGHEVILIVPANTTSWMQTSIPKASSSRMQQAIPFALEEQLAEDTTQLHFVMQRPSEPPQNVIVIAKAQMDQWQSMLQSANIQATAIIPELVLFPALPKTWHILAEKSGCLIVLDNNHRLSCDLENLDDFLLHCFQDESLQEPEQINVQSVNDSVTHLKLKDILPEKIDICSTNEHALLLLAKQYHANHPFNCLTGDYATRPSANGGQIWLKMAAITAGAWFLLFCTLQVTSFALLKRTAIKQKEEISSLYHQVFPQSRSIITPKIRLQRELRKAQQAASGSLLNQYLTITNPIFTPSSGIKVEQIRYANAGVTLRLRAKNLSAISKAIEAIRKQKLQVKQSNTSTSGDITTTEIHLSGAQNV